MIQEPFRVVEHQDVKFTSFRRYIKDTSRCGGTLTEHLLNVGRRPQISARARKLPCNPEGQKASKSGMRLDPCYREGAVEEERSCVLGSPLTSREIGQDGGGASEPQRRARSGL